jgi:hypothetical protein
MDDRMKDAYRAAKLLDQSEMSGDERVLMEGLRAEDVVVVRGRYDRVEQVLELAGIPHRLINPPEVARTRLAPEQLLIINCPGTLDPDGIAAVRRFVEEGGSLVTTDWALKEVLEPAFPGFVRCNGRSTGDEVVRIEVRSSDDPFLQGLFHDGADPLWWLEGASYPIEILDRERVRVLLTSREVGERYGESPVAVAFNFGRGDVLHMISHYYLQRAETRTARHAAGWKSYATEVGRVEVSESAPAELDYLTTAEVEAAHKSMKFTRNIILEKKRRTSSRGE